jgi:hypothetical protein
MHGAASLSSQSPGSMRPAGPPQLVGCSHTRSPGKMLDRGSSRQPLSSCMLQARSRLSTFHIAGFPVPAGRWAAGPSAMQPAGRGGNHWMTIFVGCPGRPRRPFRTAARPRFHSTCVLLWNSPGFLQPFHPFTTAPAHIGEPALLTSHCSRDRTRCVRFSVTGTRSSFGVAAVVTTLRVATGPPASVRTWARCAFRMHRLQKRRRRSLINFSRVSGSRRRRATIPKTAGEWSL